MGLRGQGAGAHKAYGERAFLMQPHFSTLAPIYFLKCSCVTIDLGSAGVA
ncbi:hypothetical protein K1T71_005591 [Dendrolimus kikuchii]|uniref:Uncharacterized protein n=1 Tax=Dendrolimus kikuchii TaxID=765133 RepID=A0ACC1D4C0_9NEOP|nr:hypothetical protein K1T71_005591 [Dendrolimus kikuchii]